MRCRRRCQPAAAALVLAARGATGGGSKADAMPASDDEPSVAQSNRRCRGRPAAVARFSRLPTPAAAPSRPPAAWGRYRGRPPALPVALGHERTASRPWLARETRNGRRRPTTHADIRVGVTSASVAIQAFADISVAGEHQVGHASEHGALAGPGPVVSIDVAEAFQNLFLGVTDALVVDGLSVCIDGIEEGFLCSFGAEVLGFNLNFHSRHNAALPLSRLDAPQQLASVLERRAKVHLLSEVEAQVDAVPGLLHAPGQGGPQGIVSMASIATHADHHKVLAAWLWRHQLSDSTAWLGVTVEG
eukprot:scaffold2469_cov239-Pinguiococcus_pyrenoidosus.AAC.14